ncbi:MAG: hypothetical protein FJ009_16710 [Chloroflexi bacterium]|nr:hypothetical protein [Chloroflexota bacterium]
MPSAMFTDTVLRDATKTFQVSENLEGLHADFERMLQYKRFAVALTYPDAGFAAFFSDVAVDANQLALEHDRLFRAKEIWLYSAEHLAENEFQRAQLLADVMGFYRAFGVEPDSDRPDALACEFEFMHYLVYKNLYALESRALADAADKAAICLDAQQKFFVEHLYPAAKKVASAIAAQSENAFYRQIAIEMLAFLEAEAEAGVLASTDRAPTAKARK